ncbi:BAR domain-containing protein [Aphelenchoides bicaudatus]|nr:BAR domain-containing protein [Aphelenchoides bicaudatus]
MASSRNIRKLWSKLTTINVEHTQMMPEFLELCQNYDSYKKLIDRLLAKLSLFLHVNPQVYEKEIDFGEDSIENFVATLLTFHNNLLANQAVQESDATTLVDVQQEARALGQQIANQLSQFIQTEYGELMEEREKLNKIREHMDKMRHGVKHATTVEKVKHKGVLYEQAARDFDCQASKVIDLLEQLPLTKMNHQNALAGMFNLMNEFNENLAQQTIQLLD